MQIENISAIPPEIDTVEKLYLWCYYQLSTTNERVEIEGEKEYLVDSELIRPDGVDPRLFLITKINLPIDENWLLNGFKLWENAIEILEGAIEAISLDPFSADVVLWLKGDDFTDSSPMQHSLITSVNSAINTNFKKYGSGSLDFNATNSYLSLLNNAILGITDKVTVEFWYYRLPTTVARGICQFNGFSTLTTSPRLITTDNKRYFYKTSYCPFQVIDEEWHHVAYVFENGQLTLFENGINRGTLTVAWTALNSNPLIIGTFYGSVNVAKGYIDSFRITKAVRYSENFNPETDTYLAY